MESAGSIQTTKVNNRTIAFSPLGCRGSSLAAEAWRYVSLQNTQEVLVKIQSRSIIAVILTGIWVNASEFLRNEVLLKTYWVNHYQSLGMTFPSAPKNGMIWVAWGFLFSIAIYLISRKFNLIQTSLISWFMAFVLMWIVTLNLSVLPITILTYAVPLSLLEAFLGSYICIKISPNNEKA